MFVFALHLSDEEFDTEVIFALDYSTSVSQEDFKKELTFVKQLAKSWNVPQVHSIGGLVIYGHDAKALPFDPADENMFFVQLNELRNKTWHESRNRRMDLALAAAGRELVSASPNQLQTQLRQLVVLITAGPQVSSAQTKEEDHEFLVSASEALSSQNIKIIIVPVGLETDFKELGLIVKRPQSLYPLSGFDEVTLDAAQNVAVNIKKTLGEIMFSYFLSCNVIGVSFFLP